MNKTSQQHQQQQQQEMYDLQQQQLKEQMNRNVMQMQQFAMRNNGQMMTINETAEHAQSYNQGTIGSKSATSQSSQASKHLSNGFGNAPYQVNNGVSGVEYHDGYQGYNTLNQKSYDLPLQGAPSQENPQRENSFKGQMPQQEKGIASPTTGTGTGSQFQLISEANLSGQPQIPMVQNNYQ